MARKSAPQADTSEKLRILEEKCLETDQLKTQIIDDVANLNVVMDGVIKKFQATQGTSLLKTFESVKTFLNSTNGLMTKIKADVNSVVIGASNVSSTLSAIHSHLG